MLLVVGACIGFLRCTMDIDGNNSSLSAACALVLYCVRELLTPTSALLLQPIALFFVCYRRIWLKVAELNHTLRHAHGSTNILKVSILEPQPCATVIAISTLLHRFLLLMALCPDMCAVFCVCIQISYPQATVICHGRAGGVPGRTSSCWCTGEHASRCINAVVTYNILLYDTC